MKIAFVGKGGSGKTTLTGLVARFLAAKGLPVLVIDADINQHLAQSLGFSEREAAAFQPLGIEANRLKEFLRGANPKISSAAAMIKTTPPGRDSRLIKVAENNSVYDYFSRERDGVRLMTVGPFTEDDLGVKCYHSKTGAAELFLNHLIDGLKEYVLVDMTAGADSFASGLFTRFDMTFLVMEPTLKSATVYKQYKEYAGQHGVLVCVIGNKVSGQEDVDFLKKQAGEDLIAYIQNSSFIRSMERGEILPIAKLEKENVLAIEKMILAVDARQKDWKKFYCQAAEFHIKNALAWGNAFTGEDLTKQIDEEFIANPPMV